LQEKNGINCKIKTPVTFSPIRRLLLMMKLYEDESLGKSRKATKVTFFLLCGLFLAAVVTGMVVYTAKYSSGNIGTLPKTADEFFDDAKVHTIHLTFTPENWDTLEPKQTGRFGGPGGGPGGPGGFPGGPGGDRDRNQGGNRDGNQDQGGPGMPPPGGPGQGGPGGPGGFNQGDFGAGMVLAPVLFKGDENADKLLSQKEMLAQGEKLYALCDTNNAGFFTETDLVAALNQLTADDNNRGPQERPDRGGNRGENNSDKAQSDKPENRKAGAGFQREGFRNGMAGGMGINFEWKKADLEFDGTLLREVAVRYKGNGTYNDSRNNFKKSMKIDLKKYSKGRNIAGITRFNLHSSVTDSSFMNEVIAHKMYAEAGVTASRYSFAEVYITVPGKYDREYMGLMTIVENPDKNYTRDHFGSTKGVVFKPVANPLMGYSSDDWDDYESAYDPKMDVSEEDKARLIEFFDLVSNADDAKFAADVEKYLDVDQFARFIFMTCWLASTDSILMMNQNYLFYLHPQTHLIQFMPWDLDRAFGNFMGGSAEEKQQMNILHPWMGNDKIFIERVFNLPGFKERYLKIAAEINEKVCKPEQILAEVDRLAALLRPSVAKESNAKLSAFNRAVGAADDSADEQDNQDWGWGRRGPGGFGGPGGFPGGSTIKDFVTPRYQSVKDQIEGKSEGKTFNQGGPGGGPGPGPGGDRNRNRGGFGPGNFVGGAIFKALDPKGTGKVTKEMLQTKLAEWYSVADKDKKDAVDEITLRQTLNKLIQMDNPFERRGGPGMGGPQGGPGFGGPNQGGFPGGMPPGGPGQGGFPGQGGPGMPPPGGMPPGEGFPEGNR